jgi:hypothetical protein
LLNGTAQRRRRKNRGMNQTLSAKCRKPTPGQTGSGRKCEHAFAGVALFVCRWFVRSSPRASGLAEAAA